MANKSRFMKSILKSLFPVLLLLMAVTKPAHAAQVQVFPSGSAWRYFIGTNEASVPTTAWRGTNFNDSTWSSGATPIGYPTVPPSNPYEASIVTTLPTSGALNYLSVFLRKSFVISNPALISQMTIDIPVDDGYVVWINAHEVGRFNVPDGEIPFDVGASGGLEATPTTITTNSSPLVAGTNVIAVQLVNQDTSSSDLFFDAAMNLFIDETPPVVVSVFPEPGSTVASLFEIQVHFSEPVQGVDASDLLVNNVPCTDLLAASPADYNFQFTQPQPGPVQVTWSGSHGIQDLAATPNAFAGGQWTYTLDTNLPTAILILNEFLASNSGQGTNALRDEDGDSSDWLEIRNAGTGLANLDGWFLTDNAADLTQWRFPNVSLAPDGYLIVFASEKDRTNINGRLHTNFRLTSASSGTGYLALVDPKTNIVSSFVYVTQFTDVSYGRDRANPSLTGYFLVPTPGGPNSAFSGSAVAPEVRFSRNSGTFTSPFTLSLSTPDNTNAQIRYVLVTTAGTFATATNIPTASSPLYSGPLTISNTVQVRARAFLTTPNTLPGPPHSESYIRLSNTVVNFSSDLPIVVLHTIASTSISGGGGAPDTHAIFAVFDAHTGRSSLTNEPQLVKRVGFNIRGSSTAGYPATSFAVELWDEFNDDQDAEVLGMPAESDWVLYAPNYFDRVLIHNPIAYEISNEVGRYASRSRLVELFLNTSGGPITANMASTGGGMGQYWGVYVLLEKVKRNKNRVDVQALQPENTNAATISGGYMLAIDRVDPNERTFTAANQSIIYQYPDGLEMVTAQRTPQANYIRDYFNGFYSTLTGPNWTNPVTGYAAWIDVDSWIDHNMLGVLTLNADWLRLSGFFFKDRAKKIEMGPIWDHDRAEGTGDSVNNDFRAFSPRTWIGGAPLGGGTDYGTDFFNANNVFGNPWYLRLFNDPNFWQRWIDRYQELRQTVLSTNNVLGLIDSLAGKVREAQVRSVARWGGNGNSDIRPRGPGVGDGGRNNGMVFYTGSGLRAPYTNVFDGTYQGEVDFQKRWWAERLNFIDTNFLNPPVLSISGGQYNSGTTVTLFPAAKQGTFVYYTLDGTDPRLPGGGILPTAFSSAGPVDIIITNNIRIFARCRNTNHANLTGANNPPISSPWSGPAAATYYLSLPPLRITEIMYHPLDAPPGNTNEDSNFEYIEVKNIGATPLNLNRFRIRGGVDFDFPNMVLPAGSNTVVVAHQAAFESRYGTNTVSIAGVFTNNLDNAGERLVLEGPVREPILDFSYDDDWYPITDGLGFSLVIVNENNPALSSWGLKESWRPSGTLNGSPGRNDSAPPAIPPVVVNEVLTHSDPPPPTDTIELYNPTGSPANIGGWFLTDDFGTPKKYRIVNGTTIPANGYIVFTESQFNSGGNGFALSSLGEEVYLFSGDANTNLTGYVHGFDFGPAENGVTFGRYVISTGDDQFPPQKTATLGDTNAGPKVGPIVISEIMYRPPDYRFGTNSSNNADDEYIELHNFSANTVPLYDTNYPANTWQLRNAVDFDFPPNVSLPPDGRLLVVDFNPANTVRLAQFRARNGVADTVPIYGPFDGNLDNAGEAVELRKPDRPEPPGPPNFGLVPSVLVERVRYSNLPPWPLAADGVGPSLQRIVASSYGNDPSNWVAAAKSPGTAYGGGIGPTITSHPTNKTIVAYMTATFTVGASGPNLSYQWLFNGNIIPGATTATLTLTNVQASQAGQYRAVVLNPASSTASSNATLTVLIPANITQQPANVTLRGTNGAANYGQTFTNATFFVVANSSTPISYQWRFNGVNIPGAINNSLVVSNVTLANDGLYDVVVTDGVGPVISASARLSVLVNTLITQQPMGLTVAAGSSVSFSVTARGHPLPFGYRWRRNGILYTFISTNSTNSTITLNNVSNLNAGTWTVVVTNQANTTGAISTNAILTVVTPPTNQIVAVGGTATFTVFATNIAGSFPAYQWRFNNVDIPGATTNYYSVTNVEPSDVGVYTVLVTVTNLPAPPPVSFSASLTLLGTGPRLSNPQVLSSGVFRAQLEGKTNQTYAIESSRDFTNWSVLTNMTFVGSPTYFVDPGRTNATGATNRFYRARETP